MYIYAYVYGNKSKIEYIHVFYFLVIYYYVTYNLSILILYCTTKEIKACINNE